jgi:outer membrane lipoprotein-sorting protein
MVAAAAPAGEAEPPKGDAVPTVAQIVDRTNRVAYYQGADGRAKVLMTIADAQGRTRKREFTILRRDEPAKDAAAGADKDAHCGDQKMYVYFRQPADVKGMTYLVWKHLDKDDDRWLYMPGLDLVKRVAASDKRTSFVGSHFFYEDVSGRNVADDTHELVETTDNYYVLKNTPKDPKTVEFTSFKMWIHRKTYLPVKIEFYGKNGGAYRLYEALKVETIQGYPTVTKARMKDLASKGETVVEYSDVKYDLGLPEDIFSERYLKNPPAKQLE